MARKGLVTPFGVHHARNLTREAGFLYDDVSTPNLTNHNTFCEWRVMYYVWKHHISEWVGFTSWAHHLKPFQPKLNQLTHGNITSALSRLPIAGFCAVPLRSLIQPQFKSILKPTLKNQFIQNYMIDKSLDDGFRDSRGMPLGRYHSPLYWDAMINEFKTLYSIDLDQELDWVSLSQVDHLHTWCNAFVARWSYFDSYMQIFSPIALALLKKFGSHPTDLELSYICERFIIINNYLQFMNIHIDTA